MVSAADAAAARNAASAAEADAAKAETAAKNAQKHAEAASTAAKNALQSAVDAEKAYERAEAKQRADELARQKEKAGKVGDPPGELTPTEAEILCGDDAETAKCLQEYRDNLNSAASGILDFLKENGADILVGLIGLDDIKACFSEGDIEACFWTVIGLIPWTKIGGAIKAIAKIIPKVGKYLDKVNDARKKLDDVADAISSCLVEYPDDLTSVAPSSTQARGDIVPAGTSRGRAMVVSAGLIVLAAKPKPKACPNIPREVTYELKGLFMGGGHPRITNGVHVKWRGDTQIQNPDNPAQKRMPTAAEKAAWGGAFEYEVPGAKIPGRTRLLVKCTDGKCKYGWTDTHYWKIYEFPKLPDVAGGSPPSPS
jgi:hypothetical protein